MSEHEPSAGFSEDFIPGEFTKPILIAGAVPLWARILIWPLRLLFAFILYAWSQNGFGLQEDDIVLLAVFGLPWLCFELVLFSQFLKRRWIFETEDGFTFSSLFGAQSYMLDDIEGISLQVNERPGSIHLMGKNHTKTHRIFDIWVRDREKPIRLKHASRSDKPDPLYGFILKVVQHQYERFQNDLDAGGSVPGEDWTFSGGMLHFQDGFGGIESLAADAMGGAESFGNKLYIWRRGEAEACFSTSAHGKNAQWLDMHLSSTIPENDTPVEGMGRFLFENKRPPGFIFLLIGAVLLAGMIMVPFVIPDEEGAKTVLIIGEIIAGVILFALPFIWAHSFGKRFHENGFVLIWPRSEKEIPFDHVETFEWARTDQYYNGAYTGSAFTFVVYLLPEAGTGNRKFNLTFTNQKGEEGNYGIVRAKLTEHLARRMQAELEENKRVSWVDDVFMTEAGVIFEQKKRGQIVDTTVLPWDQIDVFGMVEKASAPTFGIAHKDGVQGLQFGTAHKNFYPGLFLFGLMYEKINGPEIEVPAEEE